MPISVHSNSVSNAVLVLFRIKTVEITVIVLKYSPWPSSISVTGGVVKNINSLVQKFVLTSPPVDSDLPQFKKRYIIVIFFSFSMS